LALATSIGAWVNFALVLWFAGRQDLIRFEPSLGRSLAKLLAAGLALALAVWIAQGPAVAFFHGRPGAHIFALATLAGIGAFAYLLVLVVLSGSYWLALLRRQGTNRPAGG
jgi:putative peptidoglycan lipid II flippase